MTPRVHRCAALPEPVVASLRMQLTRPGGDLECGCRPRGVSIALCVFHLGMLEGCLAELDELARLEPKAIDVDGREA